METPVVKSRGRPKKRAREDSPGSVGRNGGRNRSGNGEESVGNAGSSRRRGRPPKKRAVEMKGEMMVGRYVLKEFDGSGTFLGKIVKYDGEFYVVNYEDGDSEDFDEEELRECLIGDERQKFVGEWLERKTMLDEALDKRNGVKIKEEPQRKMKLKVEPKVEVNFKDELKGGVNLKCEPSKVVAPEVVCALEKADVKLENGRMDENVAGDVMNDSRMAEGPTSSGSYIDDNDDGDKDDASSEDADDGDLSDGSCEYGQGWETKADTEIPAILPPELPPSSGTIGVPDEYVSHLFSVHGFLRTFSVRLFLSPFTLDDLVGCLKCTAPSTLLDAIHVALLKALRNHLERQKEASEGSQQASKCLRSIDWGLLDNLTWPAYLVHYLMAMGHLKGPEWKGFYTDVLDKEYCTLCIATKLTVLQILCDDALDAEEIRSEIDTREESEVGVDFDGILSNNFDRGHKQVYPTRHSKTSVDKNRSNPDLIAENSVNDVGEDGNRDECRLCGMEGMLICCDGCPSAYHSRCIGVNKLSIPDGDWFCPECTISKIGPPIIHGTSLRGAEVFGVDSYAQLFLGTCNHLLVLKVSLKASSFARYYNRNDVPKVLSALTSSPYHSVSYLGICRAISKYWELPQVVISPFLINQAHMLLDNKDDCSQLPFQSHPSDGNWNEKDLCNVATETCASNVGESSMYDASGLSNDKHFRKSGSSDISFAPMQTDPICKGSVASVAQNETNLTSMLSEQAEFSRATQEVFTNQSNTGGTVCTSTHASGTIAGFSNGVYFPESHHMQVKSWQKKEYTYLYMGSIFKPFAYINNYVHGAFAACAAANFGGLFSDENQASEVHASDPRKAMAANVSLQAKAFSSAAVRFFWPSTIKKLVEIPRERCSWCFHCKSPTTSRKACLLNQAALNATRAEMKFISGLRLEKIVEGGLYGIAAYTLFMEESFRGLVLGPFRSSSYQEQWRKKVEQASTCSEMKSLLLDLERNFSTIALSSEWIKLVDNWMDESSVPQSAATSVPVQKRGAGKRKKHVATPEVTDDDPNDSNEISWWRGGKLAKLVFQRGTFPHQVLRKAARQGGSRRLPGIYYADGPDVPKRSRQFIWRAAVEMAKNVSQLALQVRYLDQNMKWSDLVRPEQNPVDGKGLDAEVLAFRNANICDKRIAENKIMYGVVFGHQKHLSSRLMKSIIEKEESGDGKDKYWLLEARIPLYLVKEFEEMTEKTDLSPPVKPDRYSKRQRRQLRASRKDIFVYLAHKRDGLHVCPCASCRTDVLLELAVTCNSCEGYCHKTCMLSSTEFINEDIEFRATCKQCSRPKSNNAVESPISPLAMQGQEFQNSTVVATSGKLKSSLKSKNCSQQSQSEKNPAPDSKSSKKKSSKSKSSKSKSSKGKLSNSKSSSSKKRSILHCGLILKQKGPDDDGSDFRLRSIILRGSSHGLTLSPNCHLCRKPYNPHLMYIRCEACKNWYHADSVNLDESQVPGLFGFKCCRCRRIRAPDCPYADVPKKLEIRKLHIRGPKEESVQANSLSEATSEQADSLVSTSLSLIELEEGDEDDVTFESHDPLLLPVTPIEPDLERNNFVPAPQKLPVRRHMQSEKDDEGLTWGDVSSAQLPTETEPQKLPVRRHMQNEKDDVGFTWDDLSSAQLPTDTEPQKLPVRRHMQSEKDSEGLTWGDLSSVQLPSDTEPKNFPNTNVEWDVPNGGLEDGPTSNFDILNYESDFEPQTYFSFTELLDNDGGNHLEGIDGPSEYSLNGFMEQCDIGSIDEFNPKESIEPFEDVRCEVCQVAAPTPDLTCQICGIKMHCYCSPWDEVFQGDTTWSCGQCRGLI